jgi:hypothetical protein
VSDLRAGIIEPVALDLTYVYCVLDSGTEAQRLLEAREVPGLGEGESLFAVQAGALVAAVSRVPAAVFREESLNDLLTDLPRLTPFVLRHEAAIRTLMQSAPAVLPLAFGTVYRDSQRVAAVLSERADEFGAILARLRGKQEFGLKVFSEPERFQQFVDASSPTLQRLMEEAEQAGPGRAYLLNKRREQLRLAEMEEMARASLQAIDECLQSMSVAVELDTRLPQQMASNSLLFKAAYLVDTDSTEAFCALVSELKQTHQPRGLILELSGPWAPYSFAGAGRGIV